MADRLQHKYELFTKLGALFGPLQRLMANPEQYSAQETARLIARYCDEYPRLNEECRTFSQGEPGHRYAIQFHQFFNALRSVEYGLERGGKLEDLLPKAMTSAQTALDAIPIPPTSIILEAGSPFTAYCRLRELCEMDAASSLTWIDPFMDASLFRRYLPGVRPTSSITLVTCEPDSHSGRRDRARWEELLEVSQLFTSEGWDAGYRLIAQPNLHDRWVVFDESRIYSLGGSAKDAGAKDYFTITAIDATDENLAALQSIVTGGTVIHSA